MLSGFDRVLLRRQPECVPTHWMQDVEPAHAFVPRNDIGGCVTFRMANVQSSPTWVGEHVEDVKFRLGRIEMFFAGIWLVKKLPLLPDCLPFWLDLIKRIRFATLAHDRLLTLNHEWTRMNTNSQNNIDACHAITDSVDDLRRPYRVVPLFVSHSGC